MISLLIKIVRSHKAFVLILVWLSFTDIFIDCTNKFSLKKLMFSNQIIDPTILRRFLDIFLLRVELIIS